MSFLDWSQIITAIVAIYGAILSTYIFVINRLDKRRQLSVSWSRGFRTYGPKMSPEMLFITVTNPGDRTVTINTPRIKLPDDSSIVFPIPLSDVNFPHELKEGKNCRIWVEKTILFSDLIKREYSGIIKLVAEVEDGTGKIYKSKKFKINLTGR